MSYILYDDFVNKHNYVEEKEFDINKIYNNTANLEEKYFTPVYKNKYDWNSFYYNITFKHKVDIKPCDIVVNVDNVDNANKVIYYKINNIKQKIHLTEKTKVYVRYYDKLYLLDNNILKNNKLLNNKNIEYYYNIFFTENPKNLNKIYKTGRKIVVYKINNTNLKYDFAKYKAKYVIIPYSKIPELQYIEEQNRKEFIEKMKENRFDLKKNNTKILELLKKS